MTQRNTHQAARKRWVESAGLIFFCAAGLTLSTSCRTRSFGTVSASQLDDSRALTKYRPFCQSGMDVTKEVEESLSPEPLVGSADADGHSVQFWKRSQIVSALKFWQSLILDSSQIDLLKTNYVHTENESRSVSNILAAYALAYQDMTRERDEERCDPNGKLQDSSVHSATNQMLNDALADLMTRNLVYISAGCLLKSESRAGYLTAQENEWARWELCDLYLDTFSWRQPFFTSMTIAMSSTMIYLTSHISLSLSALPFLDRIWAGISWSHEGVSKDLSWTHDSENLKERRGLRIDFMEQAGFNMIFGAFNGFLAQNLTTVARSLVQRAMMWNDGIQLASEAVQRIPPIENKLAAEFASLRGQAWNIGIQMARQLNQNLDPEQHPFLVSASAGDRHGVYLEINTDRPVLNAGWLDPDTFPAVIEARSLTWRMRLLVENGSMWAMFALMGAKSYADGLDGDPGLWGRIFRRKHSTDGPADTLSKTDLEAIDSCAREIEQTIESEFDRKTQLSPGAESTRGSRNTSEAIPQSCT